MLHSSCFLRTTFEMASVVRLVAIIAEEKGENALRILERFVVEVAITLIIHVVIFLLDPFHGNELSS